MKSRPKIDNWGWQRAKHLLNRSGFGGKSSEIESFSEAGYESSLDQLFAFSFRPLQEPEWLSEYDRFAVLRFRKMSQDERRQFMQMNRKRVREFQMGWIKRMIASPTPAEMLWDKMTFFWHAHFATSFQKVKLPPLLFGQLSLFNKHAVGSFRDLLHGISRDPAMLRYLDNNQNHKGKPNENFARELMELFSLGRGFYSEDDIKEAARAFTGWTNDPFHFRFARKRHDYGSKTFLGRQGRFDGEDIVNIILEQPACAEFITRKLLAFFSFETASEELVQSLANEFRDSGYELRPLLRSIFSAPEFYADETIGIQIKSPVQLVVGTTRVLETSIENFEFYLFMLDIMGQAPYWPPNVKGWPGGRAWIDTSRLLTRYTFAEIVSRGEIPDEIDPRMRKGGQRRGDTKLGKGDKAFRRMMRRKKLGIEFDPFQLLGGGSDVKEAVLRFEQILLSQKPTARERTRLVSNFESSLKKMPEREALKALVGDMMTLPLYQLC
ncbi:MAG: DUF1800 family protein [bacterium]